MSVCFVVLAVGLAKNCLGTWRVAGRAKEAGLLGPPKLVTAATPIALRRRWLVRRPRWQVVCLHVNLCRSYRPSSLTLAVELVGYYGIPFNNPGPEIGNNEPAIGSRFANTAAPRYFNYRKASIYAGSNEVQRNIMAKLVLGL